VFLTCKPWQEARSPVTSSALLECWGDPADHPERLGQLRQGELSTVVVVVLTGEAVDVGQHHVVVEVRVPSGWEVHTP
jgi:hypothetical protein